MRKTVSASPKPKAAPGLLIDLEAQQVADDLDRGLVLQFGDHEELGAQVEEVGDAATREQHGDPRAPGVRCTGRAPAPPRVPRASWGVRRTMTRSASAT